MNKLSAGLLSCIILSNCSSIKYEISENKSLVGIVKYKSIPEDYPENSNNPRKYFVEIRAKLDKGYAIIPLVDKEINGQVNKDSLVNIICKEYAKNKYSDGKFVKKKKVLGLIVEDIELRHREKNDIKKVRGENQVIPVIFSYKK
jgi:hypothetical protein